MARVFAQWRRQEADGTLYGSAVDVEALSTGAARVPTRFEPQRWPFARPLRHSWPTGMLGRDDFVPQLNYLDGVDGPDDDGLSCGADRGEELHLLCTETLQADWEALRGEFGEPMTEEGASTRDAPREPREGGSSMPHVGTGVISRVFGGTSVMSREMREWAVRVLYPGDALLHRFFCGDKRG